MEDGEGEGDGDDGVDGKVVCAQANRPNIRQHSSCDLLL